MCWLSGFIWYALDVPEHVDDVMSSTDAIVVLTGGSERLDSGLTLLHRKMARTLFVSGVHRGVEVEELLRLSHQKLAPEDCCIVLGYAANNTIGNALETSAWMHAEGFHSLRLVTSNYHMRRSLMEFGYAMPDIVIIPHPVFALTVKQNWWLWPGTAHLIALEYIKFIAGILRHWIELSEESLN